MVLREGSERGEEGLGDIEGHSRLTSCHGWWVLGNDLEASVWVTGVRRWHSLGKDWRGEGFVVRRSFPLELQKHWGVYVETWSSEGSWEHEPCGWVTTRWKSRLQVSMLSNFSKIQFFHEYQRIYLSELAWELRVTHVKHWTPCLACASLISSICYHFEVEPWS